MLLRSFSAPILSSLLLSKFNEPYLELEHTLKLPRTISLLSLSQNKTKIDLKNFSSPKKTISIERKEVNEGKMVQTSMMGGGMKNNGGCKGGGRGSDGGNGRGWNLNEGNNHGRDKIDSYYQNMIETHPFDALLLGNYAKFLKEVTICMATKHGYFKNSDIPISIHTRIYDTYIIFNILFQREIYNFSVS